MNKQFLEDIFFDLSHQTPLFTLLLSHIISSKQDGRCGRFFFENGVLFRLFVRGPLHDIPPPPSSIPRLALYPPPSSAGRLRRRSLPRVRWASPGPSPPLPDVPVHGVQGAAHGAGGPRHAPLPLGPRLQV